MKLLIYFIFLLTAFLFQRNGAEAQILKKIRDRAAQTAENKVLNKTEEVTDKTMDEAGKSKKENKNTTEDNGSYNPEETLKSGESSKPSQQGSMLSYANYDFVPGDKIIFYYDMAGEKDAEIPGRVLINDGNVEIQNYQGQKVLFIPKAAELSMIPAMKTNNYLPEQFTLEFDVLINGEPHESIEMYFRKPEYASQKWSGNSNYFIRLNGISSSQPGVDFTVNLEDGNSVGGHRYFAPEAVNETKDNWRKVALYVNKNIGKLYFDQHRIAVVNRIEPGAGMVTFEFNNDTNPILIRNIRIAAGGADAYNKVITDGKFIAYGIQFDINKSSIRPESMGTLNEIAKMLKENPDLKFEIGGHTDSDGSAELNNKLSQDRADAVKKQLTNMGISSERLSTKGFGATKPIVENNNPENKARNRRVEFVKK